MNTMELHWVCKLANGLVDIIANEGIRKEGPELETTWINILNGQFRIDCIQLATKYHDNLSKESHIEEGSERPIRRHEGTKHDMNTQHSTTNYNVGLYYTTCEGTTTRSCQQ
jgi:hypothetical protein